MSPYIPPRIIQGPKREVEATCCGCGRDVKPGSCYTGSVLGGINFTTRIISERTPVTCVVEMHGQPAHVVGGDYTETPQKTGFFTRRRGYICDTCAAEYRCYEDRAGRKHPLVLTDPRPGYLGESLRDEPEKRSFKGFNTRTTQGRRGRRV